MAKSILVPMGDVDVDGFADIMGDGVSSLPLNYFGLPLGPPIKPSLLGTKLLKR